MPKWGLTPNQRRTMPWGLRSQLLEPQKVITDPVHGDVYITELERLVLDSPPVQRLRRVRQLGTTHLVYPGATHSRFAHTLGAVRAAQDLLDTVLSHRESKKPCPDLFMEWQQEVTAATPDNRPSAMARFDQRLAEATILARLGALLHDMCHLPFGHSIEDDLQVLEAHDLGAGRFQELWLGVIDALDPDDRSAIERGGLQDALRPLILSKDPVYATPRAEWPNEPSHRYPFVADIVGNTICADLLDYLARDHLNTGLPMKLGHRFLDGFYVTPNRSNQPAEYRERMVVEIVRDGRERADASRNSSSTCGTATS